MTSGKASSPVSDWNAGDVARKVPAPGLLARVSFPSPKGQLRRALRDAGARRVDGAAAPRLANIATGLAERLGFGGVSVWVAEDGPPNAIAGRLDGPVVAVTASLLDDFSRTELEAVVAHCLVRHREPGRRGAKVGFADDVRAAAVTRYPPALASALRKAAPYRGRYSAFYLVADAPTHRPVEERVAELLDL